MMGQTCQTLEKTPLGCQIPTFSGNINGHIHSIVSLLLEQIDEGSLSKVFIAWNLLGPCEDTIHIACITFSLLLLDFISIFSTAMSIRLSDFA